MSKVYNFKSYEEITEFAKFYFEVGFQNALELTAVISYELSQQCSNIAECGLVETKVKEILKKKFPNIQVEK